MDGYGGLIKLLDIEHDDGTQGSQIAFRFSGMIDMTDEERRALREARLFFYECGTLASMLYGGNSPLLGDQWASMDEKPAGLNKEGSELYDKLFGFRKGADETMNHQKFLALLKEKYDSLVLGGELAAQWVTLSSHMFGGDKHLTRKDLSGSEMEELYKILLEEHVSEGYGDEDDFVKRLERRYKSLVAAGEKGGSWGKLASAFAGTSPPFSRQHLREDMATLYKELLDKYTSDGMSNEQDFQKYLKSIYNRWGGNKSELRGAFKWMDDFDSLLQKVLTSEEDVKLSAEDEEKFGRRMHTYNSIGIVVQVDESNVAEKYNEIEEILSLDVSKKNKYDRWRKLFDKLKKDEMIERFPGLSGKAALLLEEHIRVIKARMDSLLDAMGIDDGVADGNMNQDSDY